MTALKSLGFESYVDECEGVLDEHKEHQKVRRRKRSSHPPPRCPVSLTPDLDACSSLLQVRQTKSQSASKKNSGMTEEELLAQQELLFAASKARFEAGGGAAQFDGGSAPA